MSIDNFNADLMSSTGIKPVGFNSVMSKAYVDYAMSVIVSRALPDVRDGLKPVHRRILFAMREGGYTANKPFFKSARIVGDVIGKYHPHGDSSVYEAMVRLAQPFSVRECLISSQGNFGSLDGDKAAAMRYTEARMSKLAMNMVDDLNEKVVPYKDNYDGKDREPTVLPVGFPNLLVNGQIGIAVGMATSIPTHNLGEAIDAALLVLKDNDASLSQILEVMPGPDFPTLGVIKGRGGIRKSYETGRGSIMLTGVAVVEDRGRGRQQLVLTEIPYAVNKKSLVEKIAELVASKVIEGVSDVRDESNLKSLVRIVVELKADTDPNVVLNSIRKHTPFQGNFNMNMVCLDSQGRPRLMTLLEVLQEFVAFRRLVVRNRTQAELDKLRFDQSKKIGLYAATTRMDDVVRIIRSSKDPETARVRLMELEFPVDDTLRVLIKESDPDANPSDVFQLSDIQAKEILEMRLRSLTALESDGIADEVRSIQLAIRVCLDILQNPPSLDAVVEREMLEIREKFATPRLTRIEDSEAEDMDEEDFIEKRDVVVTLTKSGYVKRTEVDTYRSQRRGGKGRSGMETKENDYIVETIVCNTRSKMIAFTAKGHAHSFKAFRLPDAGPNGKGRPFQNFINLDAGDTVTSLIAFPDEGNLDEMSLVFVTDFGTVRRSRVSDFAVMNKNGKIAMKLTDENGQILGSLVKVLFADDNHDLILATHNGQAIRYPVTDLRFVASRTSLGVRGVSLRDGDYVVSAGVLTHSDATSLERDLYLSNGVTYLRQADLVMPDNSPREFPASITIEPAPDAERPDRVKATLSADRMIELQKQETMLLSVSENGYGKRSSSHEYRITSRGGVGVTAADLSDKTGKLVALIGVNDDDGLVLVTVNGQTIRTRVGDVSVISRTSRGVKLFTVDSDDKIVGVARVSSSVEGEEDSETSAN